MQFVHMLTLTLFRKWDLNTDAIFSITQYLYGFEKNKYNKVKHSELKSNENEIHSTFTVLKM